jgi:DNA-binding PadR family transcriptional regulator
LDTFQVRREVSALRRHDYSVGAIYTTLSRLKDKGLVDSWMTDPLPVRGERSRRHYRITAQVESAVAQAAKLTARLWAHDLGVDPA